MMKNVTYALILALVLASCSTKKQVTHKKTRKVTQTQAAQHTKFPRATASPEANRGRSLPADSGDFVPFPIASTEEYISTFSPIAQDEMRDYGIPASITLAQGILESGAGRGALTQRTNNHFGIKCHTDWGGDFDFHDDDARGECFRKYNHPLYSFRDHSIFLSSRPHYMFLFNYRKDDYKKWAHGLYKAGYATDRKYPQKLIALIERYQLDQYDRDVLRHIPNTPQKRKTYIKFDYVVQKGDTLYAIAKQHAIPIEQLMQLNKLRSTYLAVGQVLKIQKEKPKE